MHFLTILLLGLAQLNMAFTDFGTLKIERSGKVIGSEKYKIEWDNGRARAVADIQLEPYKGQEVALHTELFVDGGGRFQSYRATRTGGGPKRELSVSLEGQVAVCEIKKENGSESTPVNVEAGFLILDTNVFHHYEILAQKILASPNLAEVSVLIPQEGVGGTLKIQAVGKESIKTAKSRISASRYDLDSGQVKITIWIDDAGKLYRISVPQTKAEIIRVD